MSNTTGAGSNYGKFYITEELGDYVSFDSSPTGEKSGNSVVFTVDSLAIVESVQLKYKVKVKNDLSNIGKEVVASGTLKKNKDDTVAITTGTVKNTIIPKTTS